MPLDVEYIRKRLKDIEHAEAQLLAERAEFPRFAGFGLEFRLNPPLSLVEVEKFERRHGVTLPEDYRQFITEICNGVGPNCEVFPLGQLGSGDSYRSWEEEGIAGSLADPFPYGDTWNLPAEFFDREPDYSGMTLEEQDRAMEEWFKVLEREYWGPHTTPGAFPIGDRGCGLSEWLIVTGPQRGYVWNDNRADHAGMSPARDPLGNRLTFADWFMLQLERPVPVPRPKADRSWGERHVLPLVAFLAAAALGLAAGMGMHMQWDLPPEYVVLTVPAFILPVMWLDMTLMQRKHSRPSE